MKVTIEAMLVKLDPDRPERVEYTDKTADLEFKEFDEEDLVLCVEDHGFAGRRCFLLKRDDLRKMLLVLLR